jgi:hypothetical protein
VAKLLFWRKFHTSAAWPRASSLIVEETKRNAILFFWQDQLDGQDITILNKKNPVNPV